MKQYQIVIGDLETPLFSFRNHQIKSCNIESAVDLIGNELTVDTTEFEIACNDDSIRFLPYATSVLIYNQDRLLGKFYSTEIERTKVNAYKITAVSAIGILSHETFYGGMYNGESFEDLIRWIVGTNGLQPYSGYYRKCKTVKVGPGHNLGNVYDTASNTHYTVFNATMQSRLKAQFKINALDTVYLPRLVNLLGRWSFPVLGCVQQTSDDSVVVEHNYGIQLQTLKNTDDPSHPLYSYLIFAYGNQSFNLGIPVDGSSYDIDINPSEGKAIINGVEYTITKSTSDYKIPIHVYAGGATADSHNETNKYIEGKEQPLFIDAEFGEYKIYDENGNLQCDAVLVKDEYEKTYGVYDLVNDIEEKQNASAAYQYDNLVPNEEISVGDITDHPSFCRQTELETEILESITFSDNVSNLNIYGWLPICSKREAIQALLISQGVIIKKTDSGELLLTAPALEEDGTIQDDRIYDGGSVTYPEIVNYIEVTEHGYGNDTTKAAEEVYSNSIGASKAYVAEFKNSPIVADSLSADNLIVCCHNCNAAVLKGTGTLNARTYEHSQSKIKRFLNNLPSGKNVSVSDATLVTMQNSEVLLDRLEAYYSSASKIKMSFVEQGEKCGGMYLCKNPYRENENAFLVRKTEQVSGIVKADSELIFDYEPPTIGEGYQNYVILTGSGIWETPSAVYEKDNPRIRVILIGGGTGGAGGYAGEDGIVPSGMSSVEAAKGGSAGEGGSGGKILIFTIDNPTTEFQYSCGVGGTGGDISTSTRENYIGVEGTDTTFSDGNVSYSSASGERLEKGVANFFTGDIYGKKNTADLSGAGKGGDGGYFVIEETVSFHYASHSLGNGGTPSNAGGIFGEHHMIDGLLALAGGAGGGGASGQRGATGTDATPTTSGSGGDGGNAVATPMKATVYNEKYYGHGGFGGCGGGGGGSAGVFAIGEAGIGGHGGYGGHGGEGGDGCVLIYY